MRLNDLPKNESAVVKSVNDAYSGDFIARRLRDVGFVANEPLRLLARGPMGGDPLLVQIGFTRFALRGNEASRIEVRMEKTA